MFDHTAWKTVFWERWMRLERGAKDELIRWLSNSDMSSPQTQSHWLPHCSIVAVISVLRIPSVSTELKCHSRPEGVSGRVGLHDENEDRLLLPLQDSRREEAEQKKTQVYLNYILSGITPRAFHRVGLINKQTNPISDRNITFSSLPYGWCCGGPQPKNTQTYPPHTVVGRGNLQLLHPFLDA